MHILVKKLGGSPLLPWRQTSVGTPPYFLEDTILLQEMCSEDEAELIESKNGKTVAPSQERQDALCDLGHNQIVVEYCHAIVTYLAKAEIFGDVIQALTRHGIVNVIEGTTCPAAWLGIEIEDIGAERVNVGCGKELVCCPHLVAR
jgi:hypothetical protein